MLGQHLYVAEYRHEARIAAPTRHDMQVDMILDPGSGDPADIPAEVEAVWRVHGAQCFDAVRGEAVHLERLVVRQRTEIPDMSPWRDEQVTRGVRELVHHHEGALALVDEQLGLGF